MTSRSVPFLFLAAMCLASCATPSASSEGASSSVAPSASTPEGSSSRPGKKIRVGIEEGEDYLVKENFIEIEAGSDASFHLTLLHGAVVESVDYESYEIQPLYDGCGITLKNVQYATVVSVKTTIDGVTIHAGEGSFVEGGGTSVRLPKYHTRNRENAPVGSRYLRKDGYVQIGWNDKEDLSGDFYGFGWRYAPEINDLYPVFVEEATVSPYSCQLYGDALAIRSLSDSSSFYALPAHVDGKPIQAILTGALHLPNAEALVLPATLREVQAEAIDAPRLKELYFYDAVETIGDDSLLAPELETVYINAVRDPCFSGTYWDLFQDKLDFLIRHKDDKKLVLFSGSSGRYGYYSPLIEESYPDYAVVNMGYYAYINSYPQLEIIKKYLNPGDVLLHSPEFDAVLWQLFAFREFEERFFFSLESGYGALADIDVRRVGKLFSSYTKYQGYRAGMEPRSYRLSPLFGDDEENFYYERTYNDNGDMTMPRKPTQTSGRISQPEMEYSINGVFDNKAGIDILSCAKAVYQELREMGVTPLLSYAPKNIDCLSGSSTREVRQQLERCFQFYAGAPVISSLEASLYPADHFYLIDNHLTDVAAKARTQTTIEDLRPYLG